MKTIVGETDSHDLNEAMSIIEAYKHLIDKLKHYPEISSLMDNFENISNREGVPVTILFKVIWALEQF